MFFSWTNFDGDALPAQWQSGVFQFCQFDGLALSGAIFDGAFLGCEFKRASFYLSLFNAATLVRVRFEDCTFHGSSFADCSLTECAFLRCTFADDNMGGKSHFDGSRWYACTQAQCTGLDVDAVVAATPAQAQ